ncbi:MAG: beta-ketoacyl-[acyl-carrier-protein] synthase family protein [Polyangiaceae bacterium]|nr:beta-ketoacyl-[acyl-carrier-protein] synthase family protein [Polyangiaceae bacterium]
MSTAHRRVVVTGVGIVSPVGNDVPTFWSSLLSGRSGISLISDFPTDKLRSDVAASVRGFEAARFFSPKETEIYGKVTQFSLGAAVEAMRGAGFESLYRPPKRGGAAKDDDDGDDDSGGTESDPHRAVRLATGCLMSTGQGAVDVFEREIEKARVRGPRAVSPFFVPSVMPNSAAALVAMRFGLMGPSYSVASACATGTHSIAMGALLIESGEAECMVVGGAEAATQPNTVAGFGNTRALARAVDGDPTKASRPFDRRRAGFVMGEGAGVLVLESESHARARGATPLAYVAGFGMSTDATNLTKPLVDGRGLRMAIERAIARARLSPGDIDYVNPHATSTPQGDVAEYRALSAVFGERLRTLPMSATKSMLGHMLGGAGAAESIATVCTLRDQVIHPSINVDDIDPIFENIDLVREKRAAQIRYALKLSAGFGGHNCALIFERAQ